MSNILIATPTSGGQVTTAFYRSVVAMAASLLQRKIGFSIRTTDSSDVVMARNMFASTVIADRSLTHLLMIDSDMEFQASAIVRMLDADKPVVACVYPRREEPTGTADDFLVSNLHGSEPLTTCDYIGTGLMLIQRGALEALVNTDQLRRSEKYETRNFSGPMYGFFDNASSKTTRMSEDFSFCFRWRKLCGGEIWAITNEPIGHVGVTTYRRQFSFLTTPASGSASSPQTTQ